MGMNKCYFSFSSSSSSSWGDPESIDEHKIKSTVQYGSRGSTNDREEGTRSSSSQQALYYTKRPTNDRGIQKKECLYSRRCQYGSCHC